MCRGDAGDNGCLLSRAEASTDLCLTALQKSDSDVQAMKKQAENLTVEYDRLLDEHSKLLVMHARTGGGIFTLSVLIL